MWGQPILNRVSAKVTGVIPANFKGAIRHQFATMPQLAGFGLNFWVVNPILFHTFPYFCVRFGFNDWSMNFSTSRFLVGGLEHFLYSHILGIIIPIDVHIFQRGGPTTNQTIYQLLSLVFHQLSQSETDWLEPLEDHDLLEPPWITGDVTNLPDIGDWGPFYAIPDRPLKMSEATAGSVGYIVCVFFVWF